jgi:polyhydroxyalkanoate synthase
MPSILRMCWKTSLTHFGIGKSAMHTQLAWLCHPAQLAESNARLAQKLFNLQHYAARRCLG